MEIFILDDLNNIKEQLSIQKPKSYEQFLQEINIKFQIISYDIFIVDKDNKEIKIDNNNYKLIKDIVFIRELDNDILEKSIFSINYDKLPESKRDVIDEKYNCKLCEIIIKNENPYLCYECQNIFHEKCLKELDNECKTQNKKLECPSCNNILPIEKWKKNLILKKIEKIMLI